MRKASLSLSADAKEKLAARIQDAFSTESLLPQGLLSKRLAQAGLDFVRCLAGAFPPGARLVVLGSLASEEWVPGSDIDLVCVLEDDAAELHREEVTQTMCEVLRWDASDQPSMVSWWRANGSYRPLSPGAVPESGAAFSASERLYLARCRDCTEGDDSPAVMWLRSLPSQLPWDKGLLETLLTVKKHQQAQHVDAQYLLRDLKYGWGGLEEIRWLVDLAWLQIAGPGERVAGPCVAARVGVLVDRGFFNTAEAQMIRDALAHLLSIRNSIRLFGFTGDVIPENPDKLERLATVLGYESPNSLLGADQQAREIVHGLFEDAISRLRR